MKTLFSLVFFLTTALVLNAQQNTSPIVVMKVQNTPLNIDSSTMEITDTTLFISNMLITVFDTVNLSSLHITLKRNQVGSDLLRKDFTYDAAGSFNDGTSYNRDGYLITIELGRFYGLSQYYSELTVTRSDNSVSDPVIFSR